MCIFLDMARKSKTSSRNPSPIDQAKESLTGVCKSLSGSKARTPDVPAVMMSSWIDPIKTDSSMLPINQCQGTFRNTSTDWETVVCSRRAAQVKGR